MAFAPELGNPPSPRLTGLAQKTCLRDEIIEYRHGVFDAMATEAVDRPFRAVIEQLQPKQRHSAKIDFGSPKHADFAVPNRGKRNRRFILLIKYIEIAPNAGQGTGTKPNGFEL